MARRTRPWHRDQEDDPLGGLVNLFDLWIVVVIALVLMLVRHTSVPNLSPDSKPLEQTAADHMIPMSKFRETDSELTGKGTRLGTAYRLESGEIVYKPD